jgi:hypothetical protein
MKLRAGMVAIAAITIGLLAAGCGGEEKNAEPGKKDCRIAATSEPTGLPADFPVPGELTFTSVEKTGPTIVVDGYWDSDLDEAYGEFKDQVEAAGYTILFTEKEEDDAEISYKGAGRSGQIALREDCNEDATTAVHITSRPA